MRFSIDFKILKEDLKTKARRGRLQLKRGEVDTPAFMVVGTYGVVRGLSPHELEETLSQIMLNNTFHMVCRPGIEVIEKAGGLHAFHSWSKPLLTDSGGFQVFSLADHRSLSDRGVQFKDPFSGEPYFFSPEKVVQYQEIFGSDVMMVLDECPRADADLAHHLQAVERTTHWAERSLRSWTKKDLALFPIVQGGVDVEMRRKSLRDLLALEKMGEPWPGIAVGGLSVGESKEEFVRTLFGLREDLPREKPHYLMGVGTPRDLVFAVAQGIDLFDCVIPSRNARHGIVMTSEGRLNLKSAVLREDFSPIDAKSSFTSGQRYSRAFLKHLFQVGEALGPRIATLHNVHYFLNLMREIREAIDENRFYEFAADFLNDSKTIYLGAEKGFSNYPISNS